MFEMLLQGYTQMNMPCSKKGLQMNTDYWEKWKDNCLIWCTCVGTCLIFSTGKEAYESRRAELESQSLEVEDARTGQRRLDFDGPVREDET